MFDAFDVDADIDLDMDGGDDVDDGGQDENAQDGGDDIQTSGTDDALVAGKDSFYPEVDHDLEANGYKVYPEHQLTHGTGEHQYVKPGDGIAIKDGNAVVLEKKAPAEVDPDVLPSGTSLKHDYLEDTRAAVGARVDAGKVGAEVGKHEVFLAQAEYNAHNVNDGICGTKDGHDFSNDNIQVGYSVPAYQATQVEQAMLNRGILNFDKLTGEKGTCTYVYELPSVRPS